ncbi:MAG: hypothetical protein LBQ66_07510 [Planctomycetaceae bacterium]|nr:hypothetical protein [Planctomycetaceae bacterium]
MPTRFGVQFQLFWCYYTQRRAGRPRSSPSPLRGKLMWYNKGQDSLLQRQRFLVLGDRNSGACWRSSCRLAPTLFTKKARRSVTHLTLPYNVSRSHCRRVRRCVSCPISSEASYRC